MKAIVAGGRELNELLIYGSMSCIFWTLTLQTTVKYVLITLRANNKGEGGIYALFALLKKKSSRAAVLTMIGASALLADGVITPAITVTSSIEGLQLYNPDIPVITIVLSIFAVLFFMQQFGTNVIGSFFGPVMVVWFLMLAAMGSLHIIGHTEILRALNPYYAVQFLSEYPGGFILLGAVFLATTGAEALYSDLGHCGMKNIRVSWMFVKVSLLLNYLGQCAWILEKGGLPGGINPFYGIMPGWFLIPGIIIATAAAIIASQALITGSFTLISEAVSLNFWPRIRITNPTNHKGQVYVPYVNWFLWIACSGVVVFFRESSNMEAAYGLSITLTMIMTTLLLAWHLHEKNVVVNLIVLLLSVFLTIETSFLIANLNKFSNGGWFTLMLAGLFFLIMYGWFFGRKLKNRFLTFAYIHDYSQLFKDLSSDQSVPMTATNLVFLIKANRLDQVESKVIQSIFHKLPKRARTYWFLHIDRKDDPDRFEYEINELIPGTLIRIDFLLGFKVEAKINLYFRQIVEDMVREGKYSPLSSFESINRNSFYPDFQFVLIDRVMPEEFDLSEKEKITIFLHNFADLISVSDINALNLDPCNTIIEKVPLITDNIAIPGNRTLRSIAVRNESFRHLKRLY
jgi:KUP system potassium uptake protein